MSEGYKIGELAAQYGISTDTLRLYDEMGILTARRDALNGYRLYDRADMICLGHILRLRRSGMSLEDIRKLVNSGSLARSAELLQQQRSQIRERIRELEMLYDFTGDIVNSINQTRDMMNRYQLWESPRMLVYPFVPDMEGVMNAFYSITKSIMPRYGFLLPQEYLRSPDSHLIFRQCDPIQWGVIPCVLLPDYDNVFQVPEGSGIEIRPPSLCLTTGIRCIRGRDYTDLCRFMLHVREQGLQIAGDLHVMTVSLRNDAEQNVDYYRVWLPVEQALAPRMDAWYTG